MARRAAPHQTSEAARTRRSVSSYHHLVVVALLRRLSASPRQNPPNPIGGNGTGRFEPNALEVTPPTPFPDPLSCSMVASTRFEITLPMISVDDLLLQLFQMVTKKKKMMST
jgi:hypothetical protein